MNAPSSAQAHHIFNEKKNNYTILNHITYSEAKFERVSFWMPSISHQWKRNGSGNCPGNEKEWNWAMVNQVDHPKRTWPLYTDMWMEFFLSLLLFIGAWAMLALKLWSTEVRSAVYLTEKCDIMVFCIPTTMWCCLFLFQLCREASWFFILHLMKYCQLCMCMVIVDCWCR